MLSTQRSGTHFTMAELRRHPQVFAFEEAFYEHDQSDDPAAWERGLRVFFGLDDYEHGVLYRGLDTPLKKRSADAVAARGLVVHYNQAVDWDDFARIARTLKLRVVHLRRTDAMRTAVSEFLNKGTADCLDENDQSKVTAHAQRISDLQKTWRDRLRQRRFPSLDVVYEELVADADGELRRIFDFLGAPPAELHDFHAGHGSTKMHPQEFAWTDYFYRDEGGTRVCPWKPAKVKHPPSLGPWTVDNQTRFMVLSTQRSGTHFIMAELRRHPQVFAFEEAFYEHEVPRDPAKFEKGLRVFFGLDDYEHGVLYRGLDTPLKKRSADAMAARGLVVHYNQAVEWENFARIAKKLELRVVHLERKDARRTAVSEFLNHGDADCLSEHHKRKVAAKARMISNRKKSWEDRLRQHRFPSLHVVYEDLVADTDGELRRIFDFLGTPPAEMHDFQAGDGSTKKHPQEFAWTAYFYRDEGGTRVCPWKDLA